ncbi:protein EFFECTOR OF TRANSCRIPTION 2 isoform X2 [Physcomitrium patens]|uniref:GIY-YIG domain-containing protein n=1 Tax=Physcomitrium patens TaxID=3218 RepID=A0A7I4DTW4_PHYPA|nr:protein EFFECTOR OF TRANSCRIPTION 2-like isoform X2 [Physcomitrium patens]|eukprot:XP_024372801.1 protein EFFECTOR OF TRANSCRIPTION 2-like isoform X2 [Physcomitrella patens]
MGFMFNGCTSDDLLMQQRIGWVGANARLRREDCEFVKHDKLFSKWKILIGPSDWSDYATGKIGIERCQVQNLPDFNLGPGVYELGVTAPSWVPTLHSKRPRSLRREDVIAVYVGQAVNIRQRLHKYGQTGAHLEGSRSFATSCQGDDGSVSGGSSTPRTWNGGGDAAKVAAEIGPRLFSEAFALGSSIAFRWAHTDSKVVAEQVESELLAVFDYAWNKGINGTRRSRDILAKLFMAWPTNNPSLCNHSVFSGRRGMICFGPNAVGIKVALRKPQESNKSVMGNMGNLCFLTTMQPQGPVNTRTTQGGSLKVPRCNVVTNNGLPCNAPSLGGHRRCPQHKGLRLRENSYPLRKPVEVVSAGRSCLSNTFLRRQTSPIIKTIKEHRNAVSAKEETSGTQLYNTLYSASYGT